jgi:hypothetical protein
MGEAILDPEQTAILTSVLDALIPPSGDGRLPGAGELGLAAEIERRMGESPALRPAVVQGLAAVERIAAERGGAGFGALPPDARRAVLDEAATAEPAFLPGLLFQTYLAYYQEGRVLEGLGLEPRPPFPGGYEMEPLDETLLSAVRRRGPLEG